MYGRFRAEIMGLLGVDARVKSCYKAPLELTKGGLELTPYQEGLKHKVGEELV